MIAAGAATTSAATKAAPIKLFMTDFSLPIPMSEISGRNLAGFKATAGIETGPHMNRPARSLRLAVALTSDASGDDGDDGGGGDDASGATDNDGGGDGAANERPS